MRGIKWQAVKSGKVKMRMQIQINYAQIKNNLILQCQVWTPKQMCKEQFYAEGKR